MAIEVARLTEADIPAASDIIQQAFADDPYFNWVFDKDRVCHANWSRYDPEDRVTAAS